MSVIDLKPEPGVGGEHLSDHKSHLKRVKPVAAKDDAAVLKGVFRLLFFISIYLLLKELVSDVVKIPRIPDALLTFIPFCVFLVLVIIHARPVMKPNKATMLMALFLGCMFIVFLVDVKAAPISKRSPCCWLRQSL